MHAYRPTAIGARSQQHAELSVRYAEADAKLYIRFPVSENTIVSLDWVSSNSLCLKGVAEPLPPAELEILEGFNIKIFDCQSVDKCRYLLITPVSQVISRIISICDTDQNWFAYYTQIN